MIFDGCTFNISGKGVNVYVEANNATATARTIKVKDCTVTSTKANKAFLNIKNSTQAYEVEITGTNTVTGLNADSTTNSNLYQVEQTEITETSGKTVSVKQENADGKIKTVYEVKVQPTGVAAIGTNGYATIAAALEAANDGDTVTLLADVSEDVTINKSITLDLGGKTVTGTGAASTATLTIANGATATVKNGTVLGTANSYYTIQNNGTATLEGITATAGNTDSSMIDSWGTLTINSGTYTGGMNTVKSEEGSTLVINDGTFTCDYGKKWSYTATILVYGDTTINGGTFIQKTTNTSSQAKVVMTGIVEGYEAITRVTGGTFTNEKLGGIFHGYTPATSANFEVSGGTFNKSVSDSYFKDGYIPVKNADGTYGVKKGKFVVDVGSVGYESFDDAIAAANASANSKTIYLRENLTVDHQIVIENTKGKKITLDFGGYTLTSTYAMGSASGAGRYALVNNTALTVKNGTFAAEQARAIGTYAALTLTGATVTQTLIGGHACVALCANDTSYTVKKSTIDGAYSLSIFANNATVTVSDSILNGSGNTLYHNGSNYGLKLKVTDTTITSSGSCGVYISGSTSAQSNEANQNGVGGYQNASFTGCTISGATNGIEAKYTDLTLDGCTVSSTATGEPGYNQDNNGPAASGFAVVSTDNAMNNATPKPEGTITITGAGNYKGLVGLGALKSVKTEYEGFKDETINVSGGTFDSAVMSEYCADGFVPTQNDDGTYGVKEDPSVAEVNGKKYDTLQEAVDAASSGATVTLLRDTKENVTVSKNKIVLDLNGHTLNGGTEKGKPALKIDNVNGMTVKDSSEAQTGTIMREDTADNSGVSSHYVIDIQGKNGFLKFEGGNVTNKSGNAQNKGASLIRLGDDSVNAYPTLTITGGTFTQDNFIAIKVDRGTLHLKGGEVNSANSYAIENWNNANITGGTVNGTVSTWVYSTGAAFSKLTISGGTVNGNVCSVNYDSAADKQARIYITGGEVTGTLGTYTYSNGLVPTEETAMATVEVTGGTFDIDPTKYVVEGSSVTGNDDGKFGVEKAYLAKVGETSYYTMAEAFKAVQEGGTITLLRDYTTGSTQLSGDKSITIDLNGKTWTYTSDDADSAAFAIEHTGRKLTVKNGTVISSQLLGLIPSSNSFTGLITYDNAGLVFEGVTATANGRSGIETSGNNTNDTVTLRNSTLNVPGGYGIYFASSGTLTIDNSTINAKTMGVQVCAGSLNITGDKSAITVTGDPVAKTENDGAIEDGAAISIVGRTGYKGLVKIEVTGGTFKSNGTNAAIKAYDWDNDNKIEEAFGESAKVAVSGGSFSSIPSNMDDLCAAGYVPVKTAAGYVVQEGTYVAEVNGKKYATLTEAIEAAESDATITLLADISDAADMWVTKNLTIDFGAYTVTGKKGAQVLKVSNAKVTLKGTTGGINGGEGGDNIAVWAQAGANVIIDGGNYTVGGDAKGLGNATIYITGDGKVTINGGTFSSACQYGGKYYVLNVNNSATGTFTVKGGTFKNFDPFQGDDNLGGNFCGEGVGITKDADGNFKAESNMVAQIVDENGGSVKAYESLAAAVDAAKDGQTVVVLADCNVSSGIAVNNITIDLNGKTVTTAVSPMFLTEGDVTIKNGTLTNTFADTIINAYGKLMLEGVTITGKTLSSKDKSANLVNVRANAEVTIDKDTVITSTGNGVPVFVGDAEADEGAKYTLNVYGKVTHADTEYANRSYAISGNGSYKGTSTINIYEGAEVKSPNCVAMFLPQDGVTNIYGGLVEGKCAIGIKSGTLNISGGTVHGTVNDNVLGDGDSTGNGISYDGSAIVVDSRNEGYAGNVKINITGGTVESYYSHAIREIGNDSSMTQLTELTVTGGNVFGASKESGDVKNDMKVRDISVKNVSVSGGTFNHEVQSDYCAIGFVPCEHDTETGKYTVKNGDYEAYYTGDDGKVVYGELTALLSNSATSGKIIKLLSDVTINGEYIFVNSTKTIDLNGKTLELAGKLFGFGKIIDSTDGTGLLKVADMDGSQLPAENGYLPVKDGDGYRLYQYTMKNHVSSITGLSYSVSGSTVKFAVTIRFTNNEAWNKIAADDNSVKLRYNATWNKSESIFRFDDSVLNSFTDTTFEIIYFTMTISGLNNLASGTQFNMTPQLKCAFFTQTLDAVTYTTGG